MAATTITRGSHGIAPRELDVRWDRVVVDVSVAGPTEGYQIPQVVRGLGRLKCLVLNNMMHWHRWAACPPAPRTRSVLRLDYDKAEILPPAPTRSVDSTLPIWRSWSALNLLSVIGEAFIRAEAHSTIVFLSMSQYPRLHLKRLLAHLARQRDWWPHVVRDVAFLESCRRRWWTTIGHNYPDAVLPLALSRTVPLATEQGRLNQHCLPAIHTRPCDA
jgi:hypothetical protein